MFFRSLVFRIPVPKNTINGINEIVPEDKPWSPPVSQPATVTPVPVYRWTLPDDTDPLEAAITRAAENGFDLFLFTSAQQIRHVLQVADQNGHAADWIGAANGKYIASIGPTCSEALREAGLEVHCEASPPKMGPLVRGALESWTAE